MVPEGWKNVPLLDVCELVNGRGFKPHEWGTVGYPIIRIQNLNGSDDFNYYQGEFNPKILVRDGELLFAWSGSRGTSFGPHIWRGPDAVLNYHTWRVVPKETTSREFLVQYLRYVTAEIEATAHGASALVHTQKDTMERRRCILPPMPEQQKIAEILGTWDKAIETTEALLANARTQKRALMRSLLTGTRRFPAFEDHPWREVRLGDVSKVEWGNTSLTKASYVDVGIPAYSASGCDGYVETGEWSGPGIILSAIGARCGKCFWADGQWTAIKNTIVVQTDPEKLCARLFLHLADDPHFWPISGGAQPFIGLQNARKIRFSLPSISEQEMIAAALDVADRKVILLTGQLDHLRTEKKSLMQQLLTGKRRVVVSTINSFEDQFDGSKKTTHRNCL